MRNLEMLNFYPHTTCLVSANVFLLLVGHSPSETLKEADLYAPCLSRVFTSQPEIGKMADSNQFISTGFTFNIEQFHLNGAQISALINWMRDTT